MLTIKVSAPVLKLMFAKDEPGLDMISHKHGMGGWERGQRAL